ncbi:hypothetical protein [Streptomyces mirabilis]|uniref:hypothetical protein n=1 Tax=Streptomyces mirabilis TaxID=68239 RepID=UPI0033BDE3D1
MRCVTHGSAAAGLIVLGNAYDYVSRTHPRTVRRLAGRHQSQQAREAAEQRLRSIVQAYDAVSSLTLRLLTVEDVCAGGGGWAFTTEYEYKMSCTLYVTSYYSVQGDVGDVLDEILAASDRPGSPISCSRTTLLPDAREGGQLLSVGQTLLWDTPRCAVEEPRPCMRQQNDPPVYRCLREPADLTMAAIRQTYGTVLRLDLNPVEYFRVGKHGETFTKS